MKFTVSTIMYLAAVILLVLAAVGVSIGSISLAWLGVAAIAGGLLTKEWGM